jgi:plasmid maintenance system antidote protein VapI
LKLARGVYTLRAMPSLLTTRKRRDPLTAAEVRALRSLRMARNLSLRAMATEIGVPMASLQHLIAGPSVTDDATARIRAYLKKERPTTSD